MNRSDNGPASSASSSAETVTATFLDRDASSSAQRSKDKLRIAFQSIEVTATGLIKALRANKNAEHHVINQALTEINDEIRNSDFDIKAAAVLKLTYLEMLGYPTLLKHAFNVIECMSSPRFHIKQIGYLAAAQSFASSTEVILLVHNLVKKDLTASAHPSTVILALTSLPTLLAASPQLAEDLLPDLLRMLTHSRPPVRRIAFLVIGKVWASQGSVPLEFAHVEKIRGGLNDQDASVVSTTVNVMLELGRSRPDALPSLLGLAPELFDLLTSSTNNWMLIKIVKLFAILTPIEPRLVRKLLPPLSNLIATTPAFSLLYECIQTVITGGMLSSSASSEQASLATICIDKLSSFLTDSDQNLRYIALKGLSRLLITGHAHLLSPHYDEILTCIDEEDLTIRLKALELIECLADRSTCKDIVARLLAQVSPSAAIDDESSKKHGRNMSQPSAVAALRAISASYDPASPSGMANEDIGTLTSSESTRAIVADYRYKLLHLILRLITRSSDDGSQLYVNISNFEWFIDTLISIAYLSLPLATQVTTSTVKVSIGEPIASALLDVTARAAGIRAFAVKRMRRILSDDGFVDRAAADDAGDTTNAVLGAAAFIVSEYAGGTDDRAEAEQLYTKASHNPICAFCAVKLTAKWLQALSGHAWSEDMLPAVKEHLQESISTLEKINASLYLPQLLRIVLGNLEGEREEPSTNDTRIKSNDPPEGESGESEESTDPLHNPFASALEPDFNPDTDSTSQQGAPKCLTLLNSLLFSYELRPLAAEAQAAVPIPDGLDLDAWVGQPLDNPAYLTWNDDDSDSQSVKGDVDEYGRPRAVSVPASSREASRSREGKKTKKVLKTRSKTSTEQDEDDDVDAIPIVKLNIDSSNSLLSPPVTSTSLSTSLADKAEPASRKKAVKQPVRPRTPSPPPLILAAGGEMPVVTRPVSVMKTGKTDSTMRHQSGNEAAVDESFTIDQQEPVKVKKKSKKARHNSNNAEITATQVTKAKKSKKKTQVADLGEALVDVG